MNDAAAAPGLPPAADPAYDALETRAPADREAALMAALPGLVAHAQAHTAAYRELLAGVEAASITSRSALAQLPVVRKHELLARQQAQRRSGGGGGGSSGGGDPFGGFSTLGWRGVLAARRTARRVFQSPGTIYEPEGDAPDYWRMARAIHAAGFRAGELVHCSFSYHLTPAGAMMESGAHAIGCTTFAGGVGNTELQLQAVAELKPHGYIGTPSFLKILLDKAAETGADVGSITKALVSGEACPPSLCAWFAQRGVDVYQCYATADLGLIAYETTAREGLVLDEGVIVEIVRPGTGDPLPDGEAGELVVTTTNPDYPLLRFGTGDLSAVLPGPCPTGRSNLRIKGWLGRADQATKVRGMFVHPGQIAELMRRHPEVLRARLVVEGELANDRMTLHAEVSDEAAGLAARLEQSLREITKLRGEVTRCAPGSLPNDGKLIEDARSYR